MKLFGEVLVELGAVTATDLLNALITQMRESKPTAEIVHELALLTDEDQLKVLSLQARNRCSYEAACKQLGFWSDEIGKKIETTLLANRRPLGEVLVRMGALTADALTKALDEYVVEASDTVVEQRENNPHPAAPEVSVATTASAPSQVASSIETVPSSPWRGYEPGEIDSSLLGEFSALSTEEGWQAFDEVIAGLDSEDVSALKYLDPSLQMLDSLESGSRFVQVKMVAQLSLYLRKVLEACAKSLESGASLLEEVKACQNAKPILLELVTSVKENGGEKVFWQTNATRDKFEIMVMKLEEMCNKLTTSTQAAA